MLIEKSKITAVIESNFSISLTQPSTVLSVSNGVDQLLGFTADDFLSGKVQLQSLIHAGDSDVSVLLFSTKTQPVTGTFNFRLRHADGRIRCIKGQYTKKLKITGNQIVLELLLQDAKSLWQQQGDQTMMANFKAMMEVSDDFIFFKDSNHVLTGASQTLASITDPAEHWSDLIGKTDYDFFPESFADIYYDLEKQVYAGVQVANEVQEYIDKDGNKGWVDNRKYPIKNDDGEIVGLFGIARDITKQKKAEMDLQKNRAELNALVRTIPDLIWLKDPKGVYLSCNKTFERFYGAKEASIVGKTDYDFTDKAQADFFREYDEKAMLTNGACVNEEWLTFAEDGYHGLFETTKIAVREDDGSLIGVLGIAHDITEQKNTENAFRVAATAFKSQEGMIITDADSIILRVNHAFTKITGYSAEEAVGKTPQLLRSGKQDKAFYATMCDSINSKGAWEGEIWNRRKNGEVYPEHLTITAVKDAEDIVSNYVASLTDITTSKAASEAIKRLAFFDPLTQLPNRRLLFDRLGQTMAASKRSKVYGALMFLDLDNFKPLNDTHGHVIGDRLLIEAANRLTRCMREMDTVARFGGDEFVVMLAQLDEDKAASIAQAGLVAEKIRAVLSETYVFSMTHDHQAENVVEHRCTASIGVVVFNGSEGSQDDIMKWADAAMYEAKDAGRNQIRFYGGRD